MVFQNYALWPHMTVAENVSYGLRIRKIPAAEVGHRLDEGLRKVNLTGLEARYPGQLSGGQQQRVALARALVLEPDILLLDEPLSNLDAKIRVQVRAEIRQLQQALRITTIYVTHDQEEALSLSDRVAVMKDGRVLQVGAPKELYERPRTRFVADFVGTNNLVAGEVLERRDQALIVRTDIGDLRAIPNGAVAGRCVLAIRPENVALGPAAGGGATDDNVVSGRVAFVSYLGNTLRYDLETRGRARPQGRYPRSMAPRPARPSATRSPPRSPHQSPWPCPTMHRMRRIASAATCAGSANGGDRVGARGGRGDGSAEPFPPRATTTQRPRSGNGSPGDRYGVGGGQRTHPPGPRRATRPPRAWPVRESCTLARRRRPR